LTSPLKEKIKDLDEELIVLRSTVKDLNQKLSVNSFDVGGGNCN
jgi:hypothetical protein